MRKNYGKKPYTYPQPVFIIASWNEDHSANAMNAAWGGICEDERIMLCLSAEHKTMQNILREQAFSVSMGEAKYVTECDYVGVVSGNQNPRKFEVTGWHVSESAFVNAPLIEELAFGLECELESYDEENCILIGLIRNVSIDERVLDENGKVDLKKLEPICYDCMNHTYVKMSEPVGKAFCDGLALKK